MTQKVHTLQFNELYNGKICAVKVTVNGLYFGSRILGITEYQDEYGQFTYVLNLYAVGDKRIFNPILVTYYEE